jgi:hypothetical protein
MRFRAFALVLGLAASLIGPLTTARAGGVNNLEFKHQYAAVGQRVEALNRYFARSDVADPPYFAYLIRGPVGYSIPLRVHRGAPILGRVEIEWPGPETGWTGSMANNPKLWVRGRVPQVPPGNYTVSICNRPCTDRIRDVAGGSLVITATPLEARLLNRMAKFSTEMEAVGIRAHRRTARGNRRLSREIEDVATELTSRSQALEAELAGLKAGLRREDRSDSPWAEIALAALVALGIGFVAGRRKRRAVDWDRLLTESRTDEPARVP